MSVGGSYLVDLAPGFILAGAGLGFSFVPVSIAALVGVRYDEAGIASGIINTSQQVGGALGTAILSTVAFTRVADYMSSHVPPGATTLQHAYVSGYSVAFGVGAALAAIGVVLSLLFIPPGAATAEQIVEAEAEPAAVEI